MWKDTSLLTNKVCIVVRNPFSCDSGAFHERKFTISPLHVPGQILRYSSSLSERDHQGNSTGGPSEFAVQLAAEMLLVVNRACHMVRDLDPLVCILINLYAFVSNCFP